VPGEHLVGIIGHFVELEHVAEDDATHVLQVELDEEHIKQQYPPDTCTPWL
jgi:hypothetical protein